MGEAAVRRAKLLEVARGRGYSQPPRRLWLYGEGWFDTRTGKCINEQVATEIGLAVLQQRGLAACLPLRQSV